MLVKSKIDGQNWLWINIPKTASTLIRNSIFSYDAELDGQNHYTYIENVQLYGKYNGFTVIRDPLQRFISGLNHVFSECTCGKCSIFYDRPPNTQEVILFLSSIIDLSKTIDNFHYKTYDNGSSLLWLEIVKNLQRAFIKSRITINPARCIMWPFILPQFLYLDGMEVRDYIFRYEDLKPCTAFIQDKLGYIVNLKNRVRQYSYKLGNVDFKSVEIKNLIYQYYEEDYKQLNY